MKKTVGKTKPVSRKGTITKARLFKFVEDLDKHIPCIEKAFRCKKCKISSCGSSKCKNPKFCSFCGSKTIIDETRQKESLESSSLYVACGFDRNWAKAYGEDEIWAEAHVEKDMAWDIVINKKTIKKLIKYLEQNCEWNIIQRQFMCDGCGFYNKSYETKKSSGMVFCPACGKKLHYTEVYRERDENLILEMAEKAFCPPICEKEN